MTQRRPSMFLDRAGERQALDRLLQSVGGGQSGVLVVSGEAGVGKTALLHYCVEQAAGFRVVQVVGMEAEMELPFAGLHQLCMTSLDRLDALPQPQRRALSVALGMSAGPAPDRFLVALAVLSMLSAVAEEQPLLCVVDDAQWLDGASAQVLGFVARRLLAESVALVFGIRGGRVARAFDGLPELSVRGLEAEDARALLASVIAGPIDERVRDRFVAETRGNPLALLELHTGTYTELAVGSDLDLPSQIEQHYSRRIKALPDATAQLVLIAAADPVGDAALLWRAAHALGIEMHALGPARDAGLLDVGERVTFRHPLVRSAAYRTASTRDRQRAHQALAEVIDPEVDADRRAWHRAQATTEPDEDVAAELEQSAGRAQMRGGLAAAAAFLERAAELTPEPVRRAGRALAAAEARLQSGAPDAALRLLAHVEAGTIDDVQRARARLVRGHAAFGSSHGRDAPPLLLAAARELEPLSHALARDTYLDAIAAALFVGRLAGDVGLLDVAQAARAAPPSAGRPQDLLLDGLAVTITEGYAAGAPQLAQAVSAFREATMPPGDAIRWLWLATHAAHDLWDDEAWEALSERHVGLARQAGALTVLPMALAARAGLHLFAGELAHAASLNDEAAAVVQATGSGIPRYGDLALAAYRGHQAEAEKLIGAARAEVGPRGEGMGLTLVEHSAAVLYNGLGRYDDAREAAVRGAEHAPELAFSMWSLVQLAEAAARGGEPELARDAVERLASATSASGTDWALGIEARSRALVSDDDTAEPLYREALERLGRTRVRGELARAHLLYGEWLRRQARRVDAREQLRTGHEMLVTMGMEAFAERARRELVATGETVRKRRDDTRDELTPQEQQIARLARDGLSNSEIAAQLFLSPRTVEWHLGKVFTKLGITSRRGLDGALPDRLLTPT